MKLPSVKVEDKTAYAQQRQPHFLALLWALRLLSKIPLIAKLCSLVKNTRPVIYLWVERISHVHPILVDR